MPSQKPVLCERKDMFIPDQIAFYFLRDERCFDARFRKRNVIGTSYPTKSFTDLFGHEAFLNICGSF